MYIISPEAHAYNGYILNTKDVNVKTLVIVESPAKAKTISRYLEDDYIVKASVGHIRDLPSSTIGVDVKNDFAVRYITMPGKEKVVKELKTAADKADNILLATDPDREGEAIAWHLATILNLDPAADIRIAFNEISSKAVKEALSASRPLNMDLIDSQQSRRILDRLVGYELSPLLWNKVRKGLSAGRVQSVATRLIVMREREISAFIPEEYWLLAAFLKTGAEDDAFRTLYHGEKTGGRVRRVKLTNKEQVDQLLAELKSSTFVVDEVKRGTKKRRPYAPFTTSSLQQEASRYLGMSSARTMRVAQQLYEGVELPGAGATALVSYIRTDSVRVAPSAIAEIRDVIAKEFGDDYLPAKPNYYSKGKKAQDAHEAIRPIHFDLDPESVKDKLTHDQYRLYKMIWERFVSSQMKEAVLDTIRADVLAGTHLFRATGEQIKFPGWLKVYSYASGVSKTKKEDDDSVNFLPALNEGDNLELDRLEPEQKFTQPPARYTEASLIKEMEELGIGRPSTYAPTISTIQNRGYVEKEKSSLHPTDLGILVTEMLEENFDEIVDTDFTADLEEQLDSVESGEKEGLEILNEFYPPFHEKVKAAEKNIEKVKIVDEPTGRTCPECEKGELVIKEGRYGKFIACNRYPDCEYKENIDIVAPGECPVCGSGLLEKKTRKGRRRKFYVCDKKGKDPECPFISWDLPIEGKSCPTCGGYMVQKRFRGRTYEQCGDSECPSNVKKTKTEKKSEASAKKPTEKKSETSAKKSTEEKPEVPAEVMSKETSKEKPEEKTKAALKESTAKKAKASAKKPTEKKSETSAKKSAEEKSEVPAKDTSKDISKEEE